MKSTLRWAARGLLILAIAAAVSGLFWVGATNAGLLVDGGPPADMTLVKDAGGNDVTFATDTGFPAPGAAPLRGGLGGHGEQEGGSLAALGEIMKNLVVIAAIVLVVRLVQSLVARMQRTRRSRLAVQTSR